MGHYPEFYENDNIYSNCKRYEITPKKRVYRVEYYKEPEKIEGLKRNYKEPEKIEVLKRIEWFKFDLFNTLSIEENIFMRSITEDLNNDLFSHSLSYDHYYNKYILSIEFNKRNRTYYFTNDEVDKAGSLENYVNKIKLKNKINNF